jgi:hypothetical protein
LGEVEEREQKYEKDKAGLHIRQWQTFILALIIIIAYVGFFAWIMHTAPVTTDKQGKNVIDYGGMTTLTGTFGIIAAAVVGYYFGTRNLEQATSMAVDAKKDADISKVKEKDAKKDADISKVKEKDAKKELTQEIRKADPIYDRLEKITAMTEKDKKVGEVVQEKVNMDLGTLNEEIKNRRAHLKQILDTKENELKEM